MEFYWNSIFVITLVMIFCLISLLKGNKDVDERITQKHTSDVLELHPVWQLATFMLWAFRVFPWSLRALLATVENDKASLLVPSLSSDPHQSTAALWPGCVHPSASTARPASSTLPASGTRWPASTRLIGYGGSPLGGPAWRSRSSPPRSPSRCLGCPDASKYKSVTSQSEILSNKISTSRSVSHVPFPICKICLLWWSCPPNWCGFLLLLHPKMSSLAERDETDHCNQFAGKHFLWINTCTTTRHNSVLHLSFQLILHKHVTVKGK